MIIKLISKTYGHTYYFTNDFRGYSADYYEAAQLDKVEADKWYQCFTSNIDSIYHILLVQGP